MGAVQESLNAERMFAEFERTGYSLRDAALPPTLAGYKRMTAVGACLSPIIVAGDELYIDTNADIAHGDLTLVHWKPEIVQSWNSGSKRAEWEAKFGAGNDMTKGIKLAWQSMRAAPESMRSWHWICKDGISKRATATGVGRVVAVVRDGRYVAGDLVHRAVPIASIDPDAATTVAVSDYNGVSIIEGGATTVTSVSVGPWDFDTELVLTHVCQISITQGSGSNSVMTGLCAIGASSITLNPESASNFIGDMTSGQNADSQITFETSVDLPGGTSQTFYAQAGVSAGAGYSSSTQTATGMFKVEVIKR